MKRRNKLYAILGGVLALSLAFTQPASGLGSLATVKAAETVSVTGSGAQGDPFVATIPGSGEYSFDVTGSGSSRIYVALKCASGGTADIKSVDAAGLSNGSLYEGSGSSRLENSVTVPDDGNLSFAVGGYSGSGATIIVKFTGSSGSTTPTTTTDPGTTTDPAPASTGTGGTDLSGYTTPTKIEVTSHKETAFTFTIQKESTLVFEMENKNTWISVFDKDGKYALNEKNLRGNSKSGREMAQEYNSNGVPFYDLLYSNPAEDGKCAKLSFYEPGTYTLKIRTGGVDGQNGFKSFMIRDYKPISGMQFKSDGKTYDDGGTVMVVEPNGGKDLWFSVNFVDSSYKDDDGFPTNIQISGAQLSQQEGTTHPLEDLSWKSGKFGTANVKVLDERNQAIASYTVKLKPMKYDASAVYATGTSKSVLLNTNSASQTKAKNAKVYIKSGKTFKLKGTYSSSAINIKGLKPNKVYEIKISAYDKASDSEGDLSKSFKICTAPNAPKIKNVTKVTKKSGRGKRTSLTNPLDVTYYYYTRASGTVNLVSKAKGANGYDVSTSWQSQTAPNKASFSVVLAQKDSDTNPKPACSGTAPVKVRAYKKVGNCTAYSAWSNTVKVRY